MMTRNTINCKEFILCTGTTTEPCTFENNNPGAYIQGIYIYSGECDAQIEDQSWHAHSKSFHTAEQYLDKSINITKLYSETVSWFSLNLIHKSWLFDLEFLPENSNTTVTGEDRRKYIICINGNLLCNGTDLPSLKYAQIASDKTVDVVVPAGSVGLVITRR